ncbi:hypothetical protein B0H65DRAFT_434511, partial [Neurospora tetraspora]
KKEDIIEGLKDYIVNLNISKGVIKNKNKGKVKKMVLSNIKKDVSEVPVRASTCFLILLPEIDLDNGEYFNFSSYYCSIK